MGRCQIHVVAANEKMIPNRHPAQYQVALIVLNAYQGQVGRSTTDIAHQDRIADSDQITPPFRFSVEPGVDGGLRLLEQHEVVWQPCGVGCFTGQFPGHGVKGSRDGQHHLLLVQRRVRESMIPGRYQMDRMKSLEVFGGGDLLRQTEMETMYKIGCGKGTMATMVAGELAIVFLLAASIVATVGYLTVLNADRIVQSLLA